MSKQLYEPILDEGIRNVHFFNGRLLTADDLKDEQAAARRQHTQLGRAAGEGVVEGLEVWLMSEGSATTSPVVLVTKGLALNRGGYSLSLPGDEQVALVRRLEAPPPEAGLFGNCDTPRHSFGSLENGFYVLAIAPASGFDEHAPARGHRPGDGVSGCGSRYAVEGVQFRFPKVELARLSEPVPDAPPFDEAVLAEVETLLALNDEISRSKLRNLLAHLCFGTTQLSGVARDPFKRVTETSRRERSFYGSYGVMDAVRASGALTDCDVPLALVYWTGGLVRFVDMWAVRRRVHARPDAHLSHLLTPRRLAEAEASFFQFQEHLQWLLARLPNPHLLDAADAFRWLPAAGLVPQRNALHLSGFTNHRFFVNKMIGSTSPLRGAKLRTLLAESLLFPPVDLRRREPVQTYTVEENFDALGGPNPPQPYVVFAHREMPYHSDRPRFGNLCQALREAYLAYQNLNKRNLFFPDEVHGAGLTARLFVTGAVRDVMHAAGARFASCGGVLTQEKAIAFMFELHAAQAELVNVLGSARTDDEGEGAAAAPTPAQQFAAELHAHLDVAVPGTPPKPSLGAAIVANDLGAALEAQNAINRLTYVWAGDVLSGNLRVTYLTSDNGRNLVPTIRDPFNYTFRVANRTSRPLDVEVRATFDPGRPDWNTNIVGVAAGGVPVGSVPLRANLADENDPATFVDVVVSVLSPQHAARDTVGTLRLTGLVPAPVSKSADATVNLTVSDRLENARDSFVEIDETPDISPSAAGVAPNTPVTFVFNCAFQSSPPSPNRGDFRFLVLIEPGTAANAANYGVAFKSRAGNNLNQDPATAPAGLITDTRKASRPVPLLSGARHEFQVVITPGPGASHTALSFKVRVEASEDSSLGVTTAAVYNVTTA